MGLTRAEILKQMAEVFAKVAPEVDFKNLDLNRPLLTQAEIDSYDFMMILTQLESILGIRIPDSAIRDSPNVKTLIDYLEMQQNPISPHISSGKSHLT